MNFHFHANIGQLQEQLGIIEESFAAFVTQTVESLSVASHQMIVQTAQENLEGYQRTAYLGKNGENVRWAKVGDGMWYVEVDEKAKWIEEGRERCFMDWLLKNAKTAKDGSKFKAIPMPSQKGAGKEAGWHPNIPALATKANAVLKEAGINLKKIERASDGKPLVGILHNIPSQLIDKQKATSEKKLWSKPRSLEDAAKSGLKPHGGIFMLEGLMVVQRPNPTAKHGVTKEAITYRTISSKHEAEGRWFYPKVEALDAVPKAYDWAMKQFEKAVDGFVFDMQDKLK